MTEGVVPMRDGDCSAGRHIVDDVRPGWNTPCPATAIYIVDAGQGAEAQFCHDHLQEMLADGLVPQAVRQPQCVAGVLIVGDEARWATPCMIDALEVIVMTTGDGGRVPVWFCEGHFHEFKLKVGPDKLTFHPTGA